MGKKNKHIKRVEKWLNKIDYKVVHNGCNHFGIYNQKKEHVGWEMIGNELRLLPKLSYSLDCRFQIPKLKIRTIKDKRTEQDTCISFSAKTDKEFATFLQFYNH